jgi:hypothetical protein
MTKEYMAMKKFLLITPILLLLAVSCNNQPRTQQSQNAVNSSDTQPQTEVYQNNQYGFRFSHPSSWAVGSGERKVIFTFQTQDSHPVELMLDTFTPTTLSNPSNSKKVIRIGQENGLLDAAYHCGDGSTSNGPCTGVLIYQTQQMLAKGFDLEFHILNIERAAIASVAKDDPTLLFPNDVKVVEDILASFEFFQ